MTKSPDNDLANKPSEVIVEFYLSQRPDSEGRTIEDIWLWDYRRLEDTHNYIQWLFPLKEKSRFNRNAPVLNNEVIQAFRTNEQLRERLVKSLKVMLGFYGLECNESDSGDIAIGKSDEYQQRKREWVNIGNHNYLRITRILTSLRLLAVENYAVAFFQCLNRIYEQESKSIGSETYAYWKSALAMTGVAD